MINKCESGKKLKKTTYRVIIGVLLFVLCLVTVTVYFNEHLALTRVDSELFKKIDDKILSANIIIIPKYVNENKTGYGSPASGVIYQKEGNTYYILTANHTFEGTKGATTYYILNYTQKTANEVSPISGLSEYYKHIPTARIEYQSDEYDIAILSFQSEDDLTPLEIASVNAQSGDRVAIISSPWGYRRNMITYGKVLRNSIVRVQGAVEKNKVFLHTAFINDGSSGSVVLNEDMKILGINIASSEFLLLEKFNNSAAVQAECLREIVDKISYSGHD